MIKHNYINGMGRQCCDLCKSVKVPDSEILFLDDDDESIFGRLILCYSCSSKLIEELDLPTSIRPFTGIEF